MDKVLAVVRAIARFALLVGFVVGFFYGLNALADWIGGDPRRNGAIAILCAGGLFVLLKFIAWELDEVDRKRSRP